MRRQIATGKHSDPMHWLRVWWSDKYKLPPNDSRLTSLTTRELFELYLSDLVSKRDEVEVLLRSNLSVQDRTRLQQLHTQYTEAITGQSPVASAPSIIQTGDPLADEWERQAAQGEMPDLWSGMSPEEVTKWKARLEKRRSK